MLEYFRILLLILSTILILLFFFSQNLYLILFFFLAIIVFLFLYCCIDILENQVNLDNNLYNNNLDNNNLDNIRTINIEVLPTILRAEKVNNIKDLHENFSNECSICLELIEPIDSYKLSNCNYHIYHKECIESYLEQNFTKCPICNI